MKWLEKNLLFTILVVSDENALSRAVATDDRTFWLNHTFRIFLFLRLICRMDNVC